VLPLPQHFLQHPSLLHPYSPSLLPRFSPALLYRSPLPLRTLLPQAAPRALCSSCSCTTDFGCSYNCDKCPALCQTCSCTASLGCFYNCDKCQNGAAGLVNQEGSVEAIGEQADISDIQSVPSPDNQDSSSDPEEDEAPGTGPVLANVEGGSGLLFPLPGGGNLDDAEDLVDSIDPDQIAIPVDSVVEVGGVSSVVQGGSANCQALVTDLDLCSWGPSCATILREQFPYCPYDCATCTLNSADQEVVVVVEASEPLPPPVSPIVCDLAECDTDTWGQDIPTNLAGGVDLGGLSKDGGEQDAGHAWTWESDGPSCEAVGGPAAGATCKFPFTYEGVAYYGCSYIPMGSGAPVPGDFQGWCSTKRDINGLHVSGPTGDHWKYVGFCDNRCPTA